MRAAWFALKIFESFLGIVCLAIHIEGFLVVSVYDFIVYVIFFALLPSATMFGCLNICLGSPPKICSEAILNTLSAIAYISIAISTMYYAEKEFFLMYLSELEEPLHPFFRYSKAQSIVALGAGVLHLLHAIFAYDLLFEKTKLRSDDSFSDEDITGMNAQPIRYYLMGKATQTALERYEWFRRFEGKSQRNDMV